jgi:cAMP-dependent protein kinase regulator
MDESRLTVIPLFAGLSRKERRAVAQQADEVDVEEGRRIVREGEFSYEFFAIQDGTAQVWRGEQFLAELGPGDFFGEMGVLKNEQRNATVVAKTPMRLVTLSHWDVSRLRKAAPEVLEQLHGVLEQREN